MDGRAGTVPAVDMVCARTLGCRMTAKEQIKALVEAQPDDASYEEILRELAFGRMIDRGLTDAREGRVISNEQMGQRIRQWQQ